MQLFGLPAGRSKETPEQREHMALALSLSHDQRMRDLASDLIRSDPDHMRTSLATLAEKHKLNYHMISEEYRQIKKSEGYIRMAQHLPDIMEQTARKAKDEWADCASCGGLGKVDGKGGVKDCTTCAGKGLVLVAGSVDHLKLVFDTFGLTGKSTGVNVNLDMRKIDPHESLGDLAGSLSTIIEGQAK